MGVSCQLVGSISSGRFFRANEKQGLRADRGKGGEEIFQNEAQRDVTASVRSGEGDDGTSFDECVGGGMDGDGSRIDERMRRCSTFSLRLGPSMRRTPPERLVRIRYR